MGHKKFIKASCFNDIHTGEKAFCRCRFLRFVSHFFSDRTKAKGSTLFCLSLLSMKTSESHICDKQQCSKITCVFVKLSKCSARDKG